MNFARKAPRVQTGTAPCGFTTNYKCNNKTLKNNQLTEILIISHMKKILFAAMAALALYSCDKEAEPMNPVPDGALVSLTFTDESPTRAFFDNAATAEAWEKSLTSLSVYVFNAQGDLVTLRDFTASELAAKSATFALPNATAGTTCDFYAIANLSLSGITTKSALLSKLETAAADYNGTFAEVSTKAKRSGGFVMTGSTNKTIASGGTTSVTMTLKRTVAKIAVQTTIDPDFSNKYSGTLTISGTKILRAASQTPIIAPVTPTPGAMTYTHTQTPATASGKYQNLYYVYENGALAEASRVTLEITATYDADGNTSTTTDRMEVVYTVPITGKSAGEIIRNGYYRIAANITGLVGQDCAVSVTVADWETPVTQNVDLGA